MVFRVAVTTTLDRTAGMSSELVAVGLTPIELPCIEVVRGRDEDIVRARAACEEADLIVLASSRPLDALWPDGSFPEVDAAVIGPATATSVVERGGSVSVVGNGSLLSLVCSLDVEHCRVAIPHAPSTDPQALAQLADRCRNLVAVPVYSTAPIGPADDEEVDGVVFVSSSAVHGWALTRSFDRLRIACLGSSTSATLQLYGHDSDVADRHRSYRDLAVGLAALVAT